MDNNNNSDSSLNLDKNNLPGQEDEEEFGINIPNMKQSKDMFKIYKYKLTKLQEDYYISNQIQKFWDLLDKDFKGEIDKTSFILLFAKIYKLILPIYNHNEINSFLEGEWQITRKQ
jgi:hypothetical protein